MKDRRQGVSTGILALASLAVIATLIGWFGAGSGWFAGGGNQYSIQFARAPGVRIGTPVEVGGIRVGRVRHVGFADSADPAGGVVARVTLSSDLPIRRGASAYATAGARITIELEPGTSGEPLLESGGVIRGESGSTADSLLPAGLTRSLERSTDKLSAAIDALTPLILDTNRLVEPRNAAAVDAAGGAGNLSTVLSRLDGAVRGINAVIGDAAAQKQLREGLTNFHAASIDSRALAADGVAFLAQARTAAIQSQEMIAEARAAVARSARQVEETSAKMNRDLDLLGGILAQIDPVVSRIARGEGTLGKLAGDDRLYEALLLSLRRSGDRP